MNFNKTAFARAVYAVKPSNFGTNEEALLDNKFMKQEDNQNSEEFNAKIQLEHSRFVSNMEKAGINVTVLPQLGDDAPDSVFPDWFTCYKGESIPEGVLIIHPMKYQSRRNERTPEIIARLQKGYKYTIDLTHFEKEGKALEGKGAIVFDHRNRAFYCARSNRSNIEVINELVERFNQLAINGKAFPYKAVTFEAKDQRGDVIYHTDCLMSLHAKHVTVCLDALRDQEERAALVDSLTNGPHPVSIIELSLEQIEHMAANAQSVTNDAGEPCMIISEQGYNAMTSEQKAILNASYKMVVSNVDMIEAVGGGSCRCMLVENWSTSQMAPRQNLKASIISKVVSDQGSEQSSACDDSVSSLESSEALFQVKQLDKDADFFFGQCLSDSSTSSLQDLDGVFSRYWDQHFTDQELLEVLPKGSQFIIGSQKRFPLSKRQNLSSMNVTNKLEQAESHVDGKNTIKNIQKSITNFFEF